MKVLMLGWELPPHNSGGLGIACYQLCKALSKNGVGIEFILPYTADHSDIPFMNITAAQPQNVEEVQKTGVAYDSYKYIFSDGSEQWVDIYQQQAMYEKSVEKLVDRLEFDVIHAHDWLTFRAAIQAKAKTGRPMILHVHSLEHDRAGGNTGNPLVHEIEYTAMMMADRIIAVSNHTKLAIIREYDIPASKIDVVHNSFDQELLTTHDTKDNAYTYLDAMKKQGYSVISNVGRLTIQKGLTNLLYAFSEVLKRQPKTILLIVGSGHQYFELIELAAGLGVLKNIVFTEFQRGKQWRDAFTIADLFVMPSISEPFGMTPIESIGLGTPALVSKQSGVSEVIKNLLKVDFWDVDEMVNQICGALENKALLQILQKNATEEYRKLSWEKAATSLKDLYHEQVRSGIVA